ncbi:MAG: phosphatidylserine decarboxylase family protein [Bacteroidota bacterium]
MTIHKEGKSLLLVLLIILAAVNYAVYAYVANPLIFQLTLVVTVVFYLIVLQFFRSPIINSPVNPKHVLAPADGKVVVIEETSEDEVLQDRRIQLSIFMSPVNVHVNRMPIQGVIDFFKYHPGKYLVAWHPKSSTENERTTIVTKMDNGVKILFRQIAGALARRIKWYVKEGDQLDQGQEFGFIKFGSRVDVFLPLDAKVKVDLNQKTKGGVTVLAELA